MQKVCAFIKGNDKGAWDRLVNTYAIHTATSPLKLKSELHNSKLKRIQMNFERAENSNE